uniref:DC-STAMP domain-containing protein 2 n=1 Tax=Petromyzon marinus TaxID=7757 RepID=A0AAJ7T289_PETMA|nr:DC-STAMP domain-containing protein 2 [Petromyzon marinus]
MALYMGPIVALMWFHCTIYGFPCGHMVINTGPIYSSNVVPPCSLRAPRWFQCCGFHVAPYRIHEDEYCAANPPRFAQRTWLAKKKQSGRGRQSLLWMVIHSVCAFLLGLIIGVFFFYTITFDFGYDITTCTYVTAVVVSFMSLGMAFSLTVRAAFILMLPYLFSKEGRIVVISMAMLTVARGPAQNIKNNFQAFATSMACGAEMATNQTKEMIRRAATPLLAMIDQIETVSGKLKSLSSEVGRIFTAIKEGVMFIWTSICNAADWLMNVGETATGSSKTLTRSAWPAWTTATGNARRSCTGSSTGCAGSSTASSGCARSSKWGRCFASCLKNFRISSKRKCLTVSAIHAFYTHACAASFGGQFVQSPRLPIRALSRLNAACLRDLTRCGALCSPRILCRCFSCPLGAAIGRKLDGMKNQFAFNLSVHHKLSVDRGGSASAPQIARSIMAEVNRRTVYLDHVIALFTDVAFVAIVYLFVRCLYYRHNYLYSDDFDNVYITERFVRVDLIRTRLGEEPLLPLNRGEASRYITPPSAGSAHANRAGSPYMSLEEKEIFGSNFVEWLGCFFYAVFFVCLDHGVYGILSTVAEFLSVEVFAQAPMKMKLKVEGDGIMANIFSVLAEAFDTLQDGQFQVITKKCAPSPSYLPVARIFHIGAMFGLALFVTVFQVYGMRLRRLVCSNYYPVRERERILFLYNKILCRRPGQLKSMWRAIRRNAKDGSHSGFLLILATRITCLMPIVNLLGIYEKHCMACACPATRHSASSFKHCVVPGCMGKSGCGQRPSKIRRCDWTQKCASNRRRSTRVCAFPLVVPCPLPLV